MKYGPITYARLTDNSQYKLITQTREPEGLNTIKIPDSDISIADHHVSCSVNFRFIKITDITRRAIMPATDRYLPVW